MNEKGAGVRGQGAGRFRIEAEGGGREKPSDRADQDTTTCPHCGESHELAKVKGCIKCLKCGFKFDCNGW